MSHENNILRWPTGSPLLIQIKEYIDARIGGGGGGGGDLEQRVTALESETSTQASQIDTLQQENTTQSGQITTLQQSDTAQQTQIDTLQQDVQTLDGRTTTLESQYSSLDTRVTALEAQPVEQEAIYIWDGTSYNVPATPIDGIEVRHFYGPNPYQGDTWPGVLDVYEFAETVA